MINLNGQNPVVVSHMSYSGLALVRSFGKKGIPVYALDPNEEQVGMNSKYCESIVCPSIENEEENHISFLIDLARRLEKKPVLFPTGDIGLLCYAKHEEVLNEYFYFTNETKDKIYKLVPKIHQYKTAVDLGVDVPTSFIPNDERELKSIYSKLRKPFIIKPSESNAWYTEEMSQIVAHSKCIVINDYEELVHWYKILFDLQNQIILSDIIPGEDRNLYYVPSYRSHDGDVKGIFVGQKTRIHPIHFGSASFAELCENRELIDLTVQILNKLDYFGLSGLEYKYDARDKKYKFIEFNARYGLWDCLGELIGVDLPYIAYCDVLGLKETKKKHERYTNQNRGAWICFERDIRAFRAYNRENIIKLKDWLTSFLSIRKCSIFGFSDMKPFFRRVKQNFVKNVAGILRIIARSRKV